MREKKKFWIRLEPSRLENGGDLDFLMSLDNGSDYVALYIKLCSITYETRGEFSTRFGSMVVSYDVDRITRECKYFSADTVAKALEIYEQIGLISKDENGTIFFPSYESYIDEESASAGRVRALRKKKALHCNKDVTLDVTQKCAKNDDKNVTSLLHCNASDASSISILDKNDQEIVDFQEKEEKALHCNKDVTLDVTQKCTKNVTSPLHCNTNVTPDVTLKEGPDGFPCPPEKIIKIPPILSFPQESEKTLTKEDAHEDETRGGSIPSLEEVKAYFKGNFLKGDSELFFYHYKSLGWKNNGHPIEDWKARARCWHINQMKYYPDKSTKTAEEFIPVGEEVQSL